jgi:hypothetical protein
LQDFFILGWAIPSKNNQIQLLTVGDAHPTRILLESTNGKFRLIFPIPTSDFKPFSPSQLPTFYLYPSLFFLPSHKSPISASKPNTLIPGALRLTIFDKLSALLSL